MYSIGCYILSEFLRMTQMNYLSTYLTVKRGITKVHLDLEVMLLCILHGEIKDGILQKVQLYLICLM